LPKVELYNLYYSQNVIMGRSLARIGEMSSVYKILISKPEAITHEAWA